MGLSNASSIYLESSSSLFCNTCSEKSSHISHETLSESFTIETFLMSSSSLDKWLHSFTFVTDGISYHSYVNVSEILPSDSYNVSSTIIVPLDGGIDEALSIEMWILIIFLSGSFICFALLLMVLCFKRKNRGRMKAKRIDDEEAYQMEVINTLNNKEHFFYPHHHNDLTFDNPTFTKR
uniref:Uncharacterized protein n=1 Tax=Clytia hemisphaerica TaxID=252671 RepID=A0A7M6DJT3_9CNID